MVKRLSVFFPVFNEEKNIYETIFRAVSVLKSNFEDWEIIVVNDGSKDGTSGEIERARGLDDRIRSINHPNNQGYGAAFRSGAYSARLDWVAFTDSDGQFDFSEITKFVDVQEKTKADLVVGFYQKRSVSLLRKTNTFLWQVLVKVLFDLKVKDVDCGFKLFSKRVLDEIPMLESQRGAFVSTEFLVKAQKCGFKVAEVGVHHFPRLLGSGTGANINVIIKSFVDLFKLWRKLK